MAWPTARFKTATLNGAWTPSDMNGVQDLLLNARGHALDGATNIATEESTTSTSYVKLATPDEVTGVVLPTNGLIYVLVRAWVKSTGGTGNEIGLFLNGTQVQDTLGSPLTASDLSTSYEVVTTDLSKFSRIQVTGDATDGQAAAPDALAIFAAAGTYTVDLRYKAASGETVSAKNRHLWVWTGTP